LVSLFAHRNLASALSPTRPANPRQRCTDSSVPGVAFSSSPPPFLFVVFCYWQALFFFFFLGGVSVPHFSIHPDIRFSIKNPRSTVFGFFLFGIVKTPLRFRAFISPPPKTFQFKFHWVAPNPSRCFVFSFCIPSQKPTTPRHSCFDILGREGQRLTHFFFFRRLFLLSHSRYFNPVASLVSLSERTQLMSVPVELSRKRAAGTHPYSGVSFSVYPLVPRAAPRGRLL